MGAAVRRTVVSIEGRVVVASRAATAADAPAVAGELARLRACRHPGVVRVVAEVAGPRPGYATAWVGAATLATRCPEPGDLAARLADAAATLADLHERGDAHGRLTPARMVLGGTGRIVLCGLGAVAPDDPATVAADDVEALGRTIHELTGTTAELEPIPSRHLRPGRAWSGATTRALQLLADHATTEQPSARPTMRHLADALALLASADERTPPWRRELLGLGGRRRRDLAG